MPLYCNIFSCKNFGGVRSDDECRFFRTPTDTEQRDKWIKEIQKYQKIDQRLVICQLHFEPKYLHINKRGARLSKGAIPTIFDTKPLPVPAVQQPTSSIQQAMIPEISIKSENVEFIPPTQRFINYCDRCVQQDVTIQAQQAKISQLQTKCTERLCIIQGLRKEISILKEPNENHPETISLLTEQQSEETRPMQQKKKLDFECYTCKIQFDSLKATRHHMTEKHRPNVNCFVCNQKFTPLELEAHICTGLESLNCTYCQHKFMSMKSLLEHLNNCNESEKFAYKCDYCRDYFFMESLLSIHMKNHDVNKNKFACNFCTKSFVTKQSLCAHERRHNDNEGKYLCDECGKGPFRSQAAFLIHKHIHDSKTFNCKKCGQTFTNKVALGKHDRNIHQDLKIVCNICGAKMRSFRTLYYHKKHHTRTEADRKHACKLCPLKFFVKSQLQSHMRNTHLANERYDCKFCKQSYKHKGDLSRHMRQHLGDDMYACQICPKRYKYIYELERHAFEHYVAPAADKDNDQMETA